eukprot:m.237695 g.237695  ORF g.237695 m.237695 type:complete len:278 (+) comp21299_c0_seq1:74-907(+)
MGSSGYVVFFTMGVLLTSVYYEHLLQRAIRHQTRQYVQPQQHKSIFSSPVASGMPPVELQTYVNGFPPTETRRWLSIEVLTPEQCKQLVDLLERHVVGDTTGDELYGLRFADLKAAGATQQDRDLIRYARQRILSEVRGFFNDSSIMPEFTHLTLRKPGRELFSHALHSDNCRYFPHNGSCIEMPSACCSWRHYSALLYLSASDGGDFVFVDPRPNAPFVMNNATYAFIRPAPGRLVFFTSGPENLHAVTRIKSGHRHALAMWLTRDPSRAESDAAL